MKDDNIFNLDQQVKGTKIKNTRPKTRTSFGYQILGLGGGSVKAPYNIDYLIIGGGQNNAPGWTGGGSGAGGMLSGSRWWWWSVIISW